MSFYYNCCKRMKIFESGLMKMYVPQANFFTLVESFVFQYKSMYSNRNLCIPFIIYVSHSQSFILIEFNVRV